MIAVSVTHKAQPAAYSSPGDPLGAYQGTIYQPPTATTALFVGDEDVTGVASKVCDTLGWICNTDAVAGSGYTSGERYATRIAGDAAKYPADVVVITGGGHDDGALLSDEAAATVSLVQTVRKQYPSAAVVLVSPFTTVGRSALGLSDLRGSLSFTALGSKATFIDALGQSWVTPEDAGRYVETSGTLTAAGQAYVAGRLVDALRADHVGGL